LLKGLNLSFIVSRITSHGWDVTPIPGAPRILIEDLMKILQRIPYLLVVLITFIVLMIVGGIIYLIGLWSGFIPGARR